VTPFVHREIVRFADLDALRHLNNVAYLRYFETARIEFVRSLWPDRDPLTGDDSGIGLIFAECHINYRSPVFLDDELAVACRVGEIRRSAFRVDFDMRVGERAAADGYGWLVGFDYGAQRACRLPDDLRERLALARG
jgi:acyl-CoA thioester hydrolase